jgi:hypothetical protein
MASQKLSKAQAAALREMRDGREFHRWEVPSMATVTMRGLVSAGLIRVCSRDYAGYVETVKITEAGRARLGA